MSLRIDLHVHPALKTWLYDYHFEDKHPSHPNFDPFHMQSDYPKMAAGGMSGAVVAHYLPEAGLKKYSQVLKVAYPALAAIWPQVKNKIENDSAPDKPFNQTLEMLDNFESKIERARNAGCAVAVAKSVREAQACSDQNKLFLIHSVEGAHSLGRGLLQPQMYLDHVQTLFDRGVCMMTLGHFFENNLVSPVDSIPPCMRDILGWHDHLDETKGLTEIGKQVVELMLEIGMIVDLAHCTGKARQEIFEINNRRGGGKRPLVFSHVGVRRFCDKAMNPSDEEIVQIRDCGGVIGVIFVNDWLVKRHDMLASLKDSAGLQFIVQTVKHIAEVAGTYDCTAIGTDYDGMTDPPNDLRDISTMPLVVEGLSRNGVGDNDLEKVMGSNILRVLSAGWGRV